LRRVNETRIAIPEADDLKSELPEIVLRSLNMAQTPDIESRFADLISSVVKIVVTMISVGASLGICALVGLLHRGP
jgi:anaerobic glycerol-3-phosphate dehydrogenase